MSTLLSHKKINIIIRSQLRQVSADFQNSLISEFSKKFATKLLSYFPPNINYVSTLPSKTKNAAFIILPLQQLQKLTPKFIIFVLDVIHTIWHVLS